MNALIFCCSLVLCVNHVFSITTSTPSPAFQRRNLGESCTFRWNVTGDFTTYSIRLLSTGTSTVLDSNTNITLNSRIGVITLFIWNIQTSNAGNYTLSIPTGPSTEVNSIAVLFVYDSAYATTTVAVGRNPGFEGDRIELNCSVTSRSFPPEFRTKIYYFWNNAIYDIYFRNTTSGPALLQNGDVFPGYIIKNDGKTLVISSAQSADSNFLCSVKEEGSPYNSVDFRSSFQIYGKPYSYSFTPASRRLNAALNAYIRFYFYNGANPPLTSYTNWSFVNAYGSNMEYSVGGNPLTTTYVPISSFYLNSVNFYGNYSITLTNSNGSTTTTFQVLPPGPPDTPSNFSVQYVTHSLVSLRWRCMWWNGFQQTVIVRLMDVKNDAEVETQTASLGTDCYNSAFNTLFQGNIQPETEYEASIWSVNTNGSSNVLKLTAKTTKRLVFDTSALNISIIGSQATINFSITDDSTKAILWLTVSCCVEFTTQCRNKSYLIAITDNQVTYDNLPTGTEYVFDFIVCDSDGYTYVSTLAILKGVRVSGTDASKFLPHDAQCGETDKSLVIAVTVLAVLLGIAVLALICCLIALLVPRCRQNNLPQQPPAAQPTEYANTEDNYEAIDHVDMLEDQVNYTELKESSGKAEANRYK